MSEDNPEFHPANLDSNAWYHISDGRVRFNGALCIANETLGTVAIYSPRDEYWQFQRLTSSSSDTPRYAIRSNQLGVAKQLAACHVEDEIDESRTQPCLRDSDGTDEQKWDVHEWDIGNEGGNTTYRLVNVKNGTDYWLDVHPNNPPFLSSEVGSADQRAQQFVMSSVSEINDGAYSTTFTNMPTGSSDDSTSTTTSGATTGTLNPEDDPNAGDYNVPDTPGLSTGVQAGIGVGVGLGVILIAAVAFLLWRRRKKASGFAANTPTSQATTKLATHGAAAGGGYCDPSKYEQATAGGYGQQQGAGLQQGGQVYHEVPGSDSVPTELPAEFTQSHELMGDQGYHGRRNRDT